VGIELFNLRITSYFYKPGNAQTPSNTGSFSHQENRTASKGNITTSLKGHSPGVISKIHSGKSSFSNFEYHGGDIDKFDKLLISVRYYLLRITTLI
jgi:hypothetical protein